MRLLTRSMYHVLVASAGPKGEGGLDDATGASGAAGGASYKQTSRAFDLSESGGPVCRCWGHGGGGRFCHGCVMGQGQGRLVKSRRVQLIPRTQQLTNNLQGSAMGCIQGAEAWD